MVISAESGKIKGRMLKLSGLSGLIIRQSTAGCTAKELERDIL